MSATEPSAGGLRVHDEDGLARGPRGLTTRGPDGEPVFRTWEQIRAESEEHQRQREAFLRTPEGQEQLRREAEARAREKEKLRVRELARRANSAGCLDECSVRDAAFAPGVEGPLVDAVREAHAWARARPGTNGRRPAFRAILAGMGVGKTVALTVACATLGHHGDATYVGAPEVSRTHRAMYDFRETWDRWVRCDLLAVDEAGVEEKPETLTDLWFDRWCTGRVTLVASNLTRAQFVARFLSSPLGLRLKDRLAAQLAGGLDPFVELVGAKNRRPKVSR